MTSPALPAAKPRAEDRPGEILYAAGVRERVARRGRIGRRLVLSFVLLAMVVVGGSGWVLYERALDSLERQMGNHLVAEVELIASGINGETVMMLRPGYEASGFYRNSTNRLRRAREMVGARRIYVFDRDGRSLLDTEPGIAIGREYPRLKYRDRMEVERLWEGEKAHTLLFTDEAGLDYMTGYAPVFNDGKVVAGVAVDIGPGYTKAVHRFRQSVYLFAGLSALLTLVVALVLGRTLTRPIQRLVTAAREIGGGNLENAVDTSGRDEIGYLGETMEEMRLKLLARDAQLRQMLSGVAHEIRNPLGGIEIYAGLIADDLPEEDSRKQHIEKVIAEVGNLDRVIADFLAFSRQAQPDPESVEVARLVEDAAFLLSPEMERARVEYDQQIPPELAVFADPEQVKRAFVNLMKNGVQAMAGTGGRLSVRAETSDAGVSVEIEDTGPGIPSQVQARLFEPFFTTREKGSGLGMAIARQAVEKNRGRIDIASEPGRGTTVTLHLPAARSARRSRLVQA